MRVFYYPIGQKLTLPEDEIQYMSYGLCVYQILGYLAICRISPVTAGLCMNWHIAVLSISYPLFICLMLY